MRIGVKGRSDEKQILTDTRKSIKRPLSRHFKQAGEAWDVALQIAALREQAGLSQKDLAKLLNTSQQQISRLESPNYEGHSLSVLRRVAEVLHARVRVVFEPEGKGTGMRVAEAGVAYRAKSSRNKRP
jgi:DNA-binding XRE family transcriptional regulator